METSIDYYRSLVNRIWSLPKLNHCHFGIDSPTIVYFPGPTHTSLSLGHLSVQYIDFRFSELSQLIDYTPNLQHLSISINNRSMNRDFIQTAPSIVSLKLNVRDAPFVFARLLQYMPNLNHLTVNSLDTYFGNIRNVIGFRLDDPDFHYANLCANKPSIHMNGLKWEQIIVNHLPKLKTFRLKMTMQYWSNNNKEDDVDKLLISFGSHFWVRERQWFIRCDWSSEPKSPYICLYTLPYAFDHFDTHTAFIRSKSTCPNEHDYWLYDHVYNLHYDSSLTNSSALNRACFSNIHHLSIDLPSTNNIWSALSTFDRLNSCNVFILKDAVKNCDQLQMLLDQAPNLYSLKLTCKNFPLSELLLLKNNSTSVRRLDLYEYAAHKDWQCFNRKQCIELCNSPLGRQCEVLRIKVENPMDAIELIYSMSNLRALNVQIMNDECNVSDFKPSSTDDEVLQVLQRSLDYSCVATRNQFDSRFIQLWIR
ncbi:unnamed protein product [Rotaria sp. Silwood2]|nr:unnamed protein product [Rotaria sp. Silwood2]CAF3005915.1 unnamed protein product [Rotaria sp. Silwood2]CAF3175289.1 unnamed protein product [Rotaria sp. Silwood2]CAF4148286.1 unnamed protein product [Rotaria sp. Silwood2]CAF4357847.1 unnamed protein product [Rotaria sp. Silwood2]